MDNRGKLFYNNSFNALEVKRLYFIENNKINFYRGWQAHKVQQRWFTVLAGSFEIRLIKIDDWNNPSENLNQIIFSINAEQMDVLHIPKGYANCIKATEENSKLLAMSDYLIKEIDDEYKYDINYFKLD